MIDRVNLTQNERALWLAAFAYAATTQQNGANPLQRSARMAAQADEAVARYREVSYFEKPKEPGT